MATRTSTARSNSAYFTAVATNFNTANHTWPEGDFNYDGMVNALDFAAIASNFGFAQVSPPALGTLIPEPALLGVMLFGFALPTRIRHKREATADTCKMRRHAEENGSHR